MKICTKREWCYAEKCPIVDLTAPECDFVFETEAYRLFGEQAIKKEDSDGQET